MRIETTRGLRLHTPTEAEPVLGEAPLGLRHAAFLGTDYSGIRVEVLVEQGENVSVGTPLCRDRKRPEIVFTASVSGTVSDIAIGPKRHVTAVIIAPEGNGHVTFTLPANDAAAIRGLMQQSGLWPALRTRPFDRIPNPDAVPDAIFVTAIDTAPHALNPANVLADRLADFASGVGALEQLTSGPVFVCQDAPEPVVPQSGRTEPVRFVGPHPAGLVGTHIARLFPLRDQRNVWHINYQDVAALGALLRTGQLDAMRTIVLSGAGLRTPTHISLPQGADLHALVRHHLSPGQKRIVSGSSLSGHESQYLSRFHLQASVVEQAPSKPRNWLLASLSRAARPAPFIPTQGLELALGANLPVVLLLRALSIGDAETAEKLGCLQLGEDDLALATYVTGGVTDFGHCLRTVLNTLEQDA